MRPAPSLLIHWIDRSSAEVLTFLTRRLSGCRIAFVMAARGGGNGFLVTTGLALDVGPLPAADAMALLCSSHPGWPNGPAGGCWRKPRAIRSPCGGL